ncbi:hypothetical protein P67b_00078 [Ruegeria phage Tedan]|nr:hypothetical protein P67b_00078 [Ruegeria phage Tedan]
MTLLDASGQPVQKQTPLEPNFQSLLGGNRRTRVSPTESVGHMGTAIYGGYIVENEKDLRLTDREKYRTFSEVLTNCSVAAAGIRYFLNLCAAADWNFDPADHERGQDLAEQAKKILFEDPRTSQARIVRRAAMYRFYGFSMQEWVMQLKDGQYTFADIAPRAQITIERWDVDTSGDVLGVVQRNPQDQSETYLPRGKLMYVVDDSLNDSPQGLGLLRHIVEPARRLQLFEQLEGIGLSTDLRGVPIGRAPYAELNRRVEAGEITAEQAQAAVRGIEGFVRGRNRANSELALLVDSEVYSSIDDTARPSTQQKFDVDLLQGNSTSLPDVARAITRLNGEIARVLGVEAILLGDGDRGSFALSQDKTNQFALTIDATLKELGDSFKRDLLTPIFEQNGWPLEAMPKIKPSEVRFRDVEQIAAALRDMGQAGAVLTPQDPAVAEMLALMGLTPPTEAMGGDPNAEEDAALTGGPAEEDET